MGFFDWLSHFIGLIPGIRELKDILELLIGKDIITQKDLDDFDRAAKSITIIPIIGKLQFAKKLKILLKLVDKAKKAKDAKTKIDRIRLIIDDTSLTCGDPHDFSEENNDYENEDCENLKSIDEISDEVIDGQCGNGSERRRRLEEAGYDYEEVQDEVNRKIYG